MSYRKTEEPTRRPARGIHFSDASLKQLLHAAEGGRRDGSLFSSEILDAVIAHIGDVNPISPWRDRHPVRVAELAFAHAVRTLFTEEAANQLRRMPRPNSEIGIENTKLL